MDDPDIHPHCFTCINNKKCTAEPEQGLSCRIVACPHMCGMMFHFCKMKEHFLLCSEIKVPCYNVESGCPRTMKRRHLADHLSVCPASVIRCTMEWRRSLKCREKISRKITHTHCLGCINIRKCTTEPQYDFSCKITSCPLNCGVTFHACKINDHLLVCANEQVPCCNAKRGCLSKVLRKNMNQHLISCPAETTKKQLEAHNEDLSSSTACTQQLPLDIALALRDLKIFQQHYSANLYPLCLPTDGWNFPHRLYPIVPSATVPADRQEETLVDLKNWHLENGELYATGGTNIDASGLPEFDLHLGRLISGIGTSSSSCQSKNKSNDFALTSLVNNLKRLALSHHEVCNDDCDEEQQVYANGYSAAEHTQSKFDDCDKWEKATSHQLLKDDTSDRVVSHFNTDAIDTILTYPTRFMGLRPSLDLPTRDFDYTFFCAQEFRRDEYPWHYKNVHADIQGGLNGWFLERCPLAIYGCPFSRQRMHPVPKNSKVIYNEFLGAFSVAPSCPVLEEPKGEAIKNSSGEIDLCDLPFEVLQHIIRYLDSTGLLNLSHTCLAMHAICETLLIERGIVTINWQRMSDDNGVLRWMDAGKKWSFTSHFSSIHDWVFKSGSCMANHLKVCKFYEKNIRTAPYRIGDPIIE